MEFTEWAEDGETRLRHIMLESSVIGTPHSRFQVFGEQLTSNEYSALLKIVAGMNDMEKAMADEPHCTCHERDGSYVCDYCKSQTSDAMSKSIASQIEQCNAGLPYGD